MFNNITSLALLIMESSWSIGGIRERDMDNGFFIFARIKRQESKSVRLEAIFRVNVTKFYKYMFLVKYLFNSYGMEKIFI